MSESKAAQGAAHHEVLNAAIDDAIDRLRGLYSTLFPERNGERFDTDFLLPLAKSDTSHARWGGKAVAQALSLRTDTNGKLLDAPIREAAIRLVMFHSACASVVHARKIAIGDSAAAWEFLQQAAYWEGVFTGRTSVISSAGRSAMANKVRYENHGAAREYTRGKWIAEASEYASKQDFARIAKDLIRQQFDVKVTDRTIREEWLRGLPAPSRPAGS